MELEFTLIGGNLRFETMNCVMREQLGMTVNVPEGEMIQIAATLDVAILGHIRLERLKTKTKQRYLNARTKRAKP